MNQTNKGLVKRKSIWIVGIIFLILVGSWGYTNLEMDSTVSTDYENVPVFEVRKGPLKINVVESGTVRPRDQVILRNEMRETTKIVSIVKEGKRVKKGDMLVELDATQLENEEQAQSLELQNDKANMVGAREQLEVTINQTEADIDQAKLDYEFAQLDLEKYIDGEYPKQLKEAKAAITIAEEELSRAEEVLKWSKVLFEEKYLSESELQQDELAAKKAELNVELAKEDLALLQKYTHERQLAQLKSDVKQTRMALERTRRSASATITEASSRYLWRKERYEDEKADYQEILEQIELSKIHAPIDGLALYASSVMEDWEDDEDRIRVGAEVDERREIIFLTTAEEYNVDIQIQETDLSKVKPGQPVDITVDAITDKHFKGEVVKVSPLPNQRQQYLNPNLKVYNTDIKIVGDVESIRNGMSCTAEILVKEFDDVHYIPIQAVTRVNNQPTVYVKNKKNIEARPVTIGLDNNHMIHIKDGLSEGELVLLKPPLTEDTEDGEEQATPMPTPAPQEQLARTNNE